MPKGIIGIFIRLTRIIRGKDLFFFPNIKVNKVELGKKGASWVISLDNLKKNATVFSFGIGKDISFDLSLIEKYNSKVFAFDPTPRSIEWLKQQELPVGFKYFPYGLSSEEGQVKFYIPQNEKQISHTTIKNETTTENYIEVEMKTLKSLIEKTGQERIDLLKMDIEGSEYDVIDEILALEYLPKQLLIEFHHRFKSIGNSATKQAVNKICKAGYKIFYVSVSGEEYSFIR